MARSHCPVVKSFRKKKNAKKYAKARRAKGLKARLVGRKGKWGVARC